MRDIQRIRAAYGEARAMVEMFEDVLNIHQDEETIMTQAALKEARDNRDRLEDYLRRHDMDFIETMAAHTRQLDREFNDMLASGVI